TDLPPAGLSGGSSTTTSLLPVLAIGCDKLRDQLARAVISDNGLFSGVTPTDLRLTRGFLVAKDGRSIKVSEAFARLGTNKVETVAQFSPEGRQEESLPKIHDG